MQEEIKKLEKELNIIKEKIKENEALHRDLEIKSSKLEEENFDLNNERVKISNKIKRLENMNRKKYAVVIITQSYKEECVKEFETLKECYDYIDDKIIYMLKNIKNIRIDINHTRLQNEKN